MNPDYAEEALSLLHSQRQPLVDAGSSSASKRPFTYDEVNHVLAHALDQEPPSLGLVHALLAMGADVNYARRGASSVWKKMVGKQQKAKRASFLQRAAARAAPDVVAALAAHADQRTLDGAMACARLRGDAAVVRVLLDYGADPEALAPGLRRRVDPEDNYGDAATPWDEDRVPPPPPPPQDLPTGEAWHQEQLDRVMARRGYKSMENLSAAARADQERLRLKIAEMQCKKMRASTTWSQSSGFGDGHQDATLRPRPSEEGGP